MKYFIFSAISISILSLILSVLVFTQINNVGRYQVFDSKGFVYIIDTKTSRLFIRSLFPCGGRVICYDFGTLDKPLYEDIVFNLQPSEWEDIPAPTVLYEENVRNLQSRDSFVPDKP